MGDTFLGQVVAFGDRGGIILVMKQIRFRMPDGMAERVDRIKHATESRNGWMVRAIERVLDYYEATGQFPRLPIARAVSDQGEVGVVPLPAEPARGPMYDPDKRAAFKAMQERLASPAPPEEPPVDDLHYDPDMDGGL